MGKTSLPPGFRFHPTDVELVKYYLKRKVMGKKLCEVIAEVDIYKYAPWDLPDKSCLGSRDLKWFFFCPCEKKYANGARIKRATEFGFWKTTGKDRLVHYNNEVVGMIKTLVFHRGKAPKGDRTDWVMHEYRIQEKDLADRGIVQDAYVLCIIFQKEGPGPRNGAQYGAPFRDEDWDDDDDNVNVNCLEVMSSAGLYMPVPNKVNPFAASSVVLDGHCIGPSESCLSDTIPKVLPPAIVGNDVPNGGQCIGSSESCLSDTIPKVLPPAIVGNDVPNGYALLDDDIVSMLYHFTEENTDVQTENGLDKNHEHNENFGVTPLDGVDIYNGLADLGNLGGVPGYLYDFIGSSNAAYDMHQMLVDDNEPYIELLDLDAPLNGSTEASQSKVNCPDELITDQSSYNHEQPRHLVDPVSSQSVPMMPEGPIGVDDQLAACFKDNYFYGNASQALLNHGDVNHFDELYQGSHHALEDQRGGGFNYPG